MIETMSNLQTPPIVLTGPIVQATSNGAPADPSEVVPTAPARFAVFKQDDAGWVLRDYRADLDYPFHTKAAAIEAMPLRLEGQSFIGSPIHLDQYGAATEAIEVFA